MRSASSLRRASWLLATVFACLLVRPLPAAATCSSPADESLDTDGDGLCDLDDAVDAPLNVLKIRIKQSSRLGQPTTNGSIVVRGDFYVSPTTDVFDASDGIIVRVVDSYLPPAGPLDVSDAWEPSECVTNRKGQIRCTTTDTGRTAIFKALTRSPGVVRFTLRLKHLDIEAPFLQPVTVTVTSHGVTDRVDVADECRATISGIVCKKL